MKQAAGDFIIGFLLALAVACSAGGAVLASTLDDLCNQQGLVLSWSFECEEP